MKSTYLINKVQADGSLALTVVSQEEWYKIIQQNRTLPPKQKRYFIDDWIVEGKQADRMVIEVSHADYRRWNREHMQSMRNRKCMARFSHISLDATGSNVSKLTLQDTLAGDNSETILQDVVMAELIYALQKWQPWGIDFLILYLNGQKRSSPRLLAEKYGVSIRMARNYRVQFEKFIKKFLI